MAYTGKLGAANSKLGSIILGASDSSEETFIGKHGQAQAYILGKYGHGQANADIKNIYKVFAQALSVIHRSQAFAYAQAYLPASPYTDIVKIDSPIFYFKLDEASGSTAYATIGANGTYNTSGVTYQIASPIAFEPKPYAVNINNAGNFASNGSEVTQTFTIEVWGKPTSSITTVSQQTSGVYGTSGQNYIAWPTQKGSNRGAGISFGTNAIQVFEHGDGNLYAPLVQTGTYNGWTHVVVVYSSGTPSLYVNGVFIKTGLTSGQTKYSPTSFLSANGGYGPYDGGADEIAVYNYALTDTQIAAHYDAAMPRAFAQAAAYIIVNKQYAQAQAIINQALQAANTQADIKQTYQGYAQANAYIKAININAFAQAHVLILTKLVYAQTQVHIRITDNSAFAQVKTDIRRHDNIYTGLSRAFIVNYFRKYGVAQGTIKAGQFNKIRIAQALAQIATQRPTGQAGANIAMYGSYTTYTKQAQAQAQIIDPTALFARVSTQSVSALIAPSTDADVRVSTQSVSVLILPIQEATVRVSTQSISVLIEHNYYPKSGNAQAVIKAKMGIGQARANIGPPLVVAQAQSTLSKQVRKYGNAQAKIGHFAYASTQGAVKTNYQSYAQANAFILTRLQFAQARPLIKRFEQAYGQAQAYYKMAQRVAQAQAQIFSSITSKIRVTQVGIEAVTYGEPKSRITQTGVEVTIRRIPAPFARITQTGIEAIVKGLNPSARITQTGIEVIIKPPSYTLVFGQAQASILRQIGWAQAQSYIWYLDQLKHAQAQGILSYPYWGTGLSKAYILGTPPKFAQAQGDIKVSDNNSSGQAQAWMIPPSAWGQAQADIFTTYQVFAQSNAFIQKQAGYANAQGWIKKFDYTVYGQSQAWIAKRQMFAQAQALLHRYQGYANAQAKIQPVQFWKSGQAQATIRSRDRAHGQAQSNIQWRNRAYAQASAMFGNFKPAQAQGYIFAYNVNNHGNAQADIDNGGYLVQYGQDKLPGYAHEEMFDSIARIAVHRAPYIDGTLDEYLGIQNKNIDISLTVMGSDYADCKAQIQRAATIVRKYDRFAPLYVQRRDAHYMVLTQNIRMEKDAESSRKAVVYQVSFEAKPWLISNAEYTISGGSGILTATRDIYDGGYSPTLVTLTGTDITISGYTASEYTGFISVSGVVTDLTIDTENYRVLMNGALAYEYMNNLDFGLYVGPGTTYFSVTGATECTIRYNNRWYL